MQETDKYYIVNIREAIQEYNNLPNIIDTFSCPLNLDVENFLKNNAINFSKKHQAITYLIISKSKSELVGYFALTIKPLLITADSFSNTIRRKFERFSRLNDIDNTYNLSAYLIAQLGKNFSNSITEKISGNELLNIALSHVKILQYQVGGMVTFVEAENLEKLLAYYSNNGYKSFAKRAPSDSNKHELIRLLKIL